MSSNKQELMIATFEDGTHAVLRADPATPPRLELIATFYDVAHARDYVRVHTAEEHQVTKRPVVKQAAKGAPKRTSVAKSAQAPKATSKPLSAPSLKIASEAMPKRALRTQSQPASEAKAEQAAAGMTERQTAVLKALRSLMDKKDRVEAPAAVLAKASSIPLGSVHSILVSLEKKNLIKTERQGSPKQSAIYQVLETSQKSTRSLNGAVHSEAAAA